VKNRRTEAATELGRHADQLAAAIDAFAITVAPLAKAIPDVVSRTPHATRISGAGSSGYSVSLWASFAVSSPGRTCDSDPVQAKAPLADRSTAISNRLKTLSRNQDPFRTSV